MSDKSEGPGWWIASDGKWYPPELHPSVREESTTAPSIQGLDGVPRRRWDDDPSKATHVGPQFPDLFQKALQGSHVADNISVKYDGEERRAGGSGSMAGAGVSASPTAPGNGTADGSSGVVGATIGAPVSKKRWRKGR
jgi:hypothetical protein